MRSTDNDQRSRFTPSRLAVEYVELSPFEPDAVRRAT